MRLIDADALKAEMEDIARELFDDNGHFKIHMADVLYTLEDAPTIDACPYYHHEPTGESFCEKDDRRHGKWIDIDGDGTYWLCSVCGEVLCCNNNYCPNCGAKMDGERSE